MRIAAQIKTNAKQALIREEGGVWFIAVCDSPIEGKANQKVIELVAEHFDKPKSAIRILKGISSKRKIIEIDDKR